jgi:hypothetical protein
MKIKFAAVVSLLIVFTSCKDKAKEDDVKSDNSIDAARNFIRATLDGKYNEAKQYLLQDTINLNYFDVAERSYQRAGQDLKDGYRGASIRIHQPVINVNDSTTILVFSNSYKNNPDTLRLVKTNSEWLVDLKYLFEHDTDTVTFKKPVTNDTAQ